MKLTIIAILAFISLPSSAETAYLWYLPTEINDGVILCVYKTDKENNYALRAKVADGCLKHFNVGLKFYADSKITGISATKLEICSRILFLKWLVDEIDD